MSKFDADLLTAPKILKDFIYQYKCKKDIFDLEERHVNMDTNLCNTNFFSDNFILDIFFLFLAAIISVVVTLLAIYLLCKHKKLRNLVTNLAFQQIKEVGTVTTEEDVITASMCKIQFYIWSLNG